ncbi:MAG: hypothetical protein Q8M40_03770 [Legionella sp.]|nr:hypothetical protein [Legionella sp.]
MRAKVTVVQERISYSLAIGLAAGVLNSIIRRSITPRDNSSIAESSAAVCIGVFTLLFSLSTAVNAKRSHRFTFRADNGSDPVASMARMTGVYLIGALTGIVEYNLLFNRNIGFDPLLACLLGPILPLASATSVACMEGMLGYSLGDEKREKKSIINCI